MSDTEQDDAKRRQRARFVEALTKTAQQPGERSRVGTRIAGATALLALAAGATLGLGAWRSYQSDEDSKQQHLAAQQRRISPSASSSPTGGRETGKKAPAKHPVAAGAGAGAALPPVDTVTSPSPEAEKKKKEEEAPKEKKQSTLADASRSRVLLKNAHSGMCADVSGYGKGAVNQPIMQYYCDGTDKDNQLWSMSVRGAGQGPGGADLVLFANVKDGLCLDVPMFGAQPPATKLIEARCDGSTRDNQLWWLDPVADGTVRVRNYASNHLCMEVKDDSMARATQLQLDDCGTDADSRWTVVG
ncbi:RICIN domain-containing protein [Streptomyces sp. NBC_01363]|uniref:RICIN domain-containing protein n=1 Tax=Streptomyces sp. NBC_01363 TaxID=2903840 RepID=UPI002251CC63|nr:RICIN domain-containing protein [Streptomyces sp. NBC_01363]MCX4736235.1 RICIN domain-containing protein [Streptomyces sp. NBC_01363]